GRDLLRGRARPPLPRAVSRRRVRVPAAPGRRALRAAGAGDQPGGALMAHHPQEARSLPPRVRRVRRGAGGGVWRCRSRPPPGRRGDREEPPQGGRGDRQRAAHPGPARMARLVRGMAGCASSPLQRSLGEAVQADLPLHGRRDRGRVPDEHRLPAGRPPGGVPRLRPRRCPRPALDAPTPHPGHPV
ncbi:MAG: DNA-3-methyladenine glycosylase, partial [uncultured Gemmatimonadetes bacterium]